MSHSLYSHVNVYIFAFIGAYPMCEIQALILRELLNFFYFSNFYIYSLQCFLAVCYSDKEM